jgi:HAD superfamily hydrolase (TIGR01509 family)
VSAVPVFDAVLFDCDGVLVDSESITCGALRDMLAASGWRMTLTECMDQFVGKTVRSEATAIEHHTGQPLTDAWMAAFYAERDRRLRERVQLVEGALALVAQAQAHCAGRIAVCSGADKPKLELMLGQLGVLSLFGDHVYSGHDCARSKPFPDVYLAGAQALGVSPERCLVIEDSTIGVRAGVAAGATVWGYTGLRVQDLKAVGAVSEWDSLHAMAAQLATSVAR